MLHSFLKQTEPAKTWKFHYLEISTEELVICSMNGTGRFSAYQRVGTGQFAEPKNAYMSETEGLGHIPGD